MSQLMTPHGEATHWHLDLGATASTQKTAYFKVWAPSQQKLSVKVEGKGCFPMHRDHEGFFFTQVSGVGIGDRYFYLLENGTQRPDPVSRLLPATVHGPTEIIDTHGFPWTDHQWKGIEWRHCIFYEIHTGTFTPEGTFEAIIEKIPYLKSLGITCIQLMPIAQCPGKWNWGYDGSSLYAVAKQYGGPQHFKALVNACHAQGIALCLDVVYNHMGPEGNYLSDFGPYFTDAYHTPWGKAFNYDGAYSPYVRDFVIKNALHWIVEYHVDALRLDAIHGIYDFNAIPMLLELRQAAIEIAKKTGRHIHVIAESDLNDSRVIRPLHEGGWNFSGMWNDDFHHAAHVAFTGEKQGYYLDFNGISDLPLAMNGFVFEGQDSPYRKRRHGNSSKGIPCEKFVVFTQNHDQVGNRPRGDRLFSHQKIAAALTVLSPGIPLLFMGQECGERHPFEYFVDYQDEQLMRSVDEGRKRDFNCAEMTFPGKEAFEHSKLSWNHPSSSELFDWYQKLLLLRKAHPPSSKILTGEVHCLTEENEKWIAWEYPTEKGEILAVLCNLGQEVKKWEESSWPFSHLKDVKLLLAFPISQERFHSQPDSVSIFLGKPRLKHS